MLVQLNKCVVVCGSDFQRGHSGHSGHEIIAGEFNTYFVSIGTSVENNKSNITNNAFHTYLTNKPTCTCGKILISDL